MTSFLLGGVAGMLSNAMRSSSVLIAFGDVNMILHFKEVSFFIQNLTYIPDVKYIRKRDGDQIRPVTRTSSLGDVLYVTLFFAIYQVSYEISH